jgi:predicted MFS family arabinose efflux permease
LNRYLLIVMLGAFVAQTTEYLPIGLLPQIGYSLGVSGAHVGILVTGYAWLAALTAVPFTLATNRLDRRTLFLALLAVIAMANLSYTYVESLLTVVAGVSETRVPSLLFVFGLAGAVGTLIAGLRSSCRVTTESQAVKWHSLRDLRR